VDHQEKAWQRRQQQKQQQQQQQQTKVQTSLAHQRVSKVSMTILKRDFGLHEHLSREMFSVDTCL
jgi:hypothetical protein